ncbi:APC family permease [Lactococcus termiticola]|uniref:Amino acid permease n=1 Tax=Lactococcus termiticola TaxID=2169526 RepID=A0A2R5HKQ5_9LACT|nr:amino acid permease [Lactococcus termiticola]GBG97488.1 amino acid permease [Lactococcus termiticola]
MNLFRKRTSLEKTEMKRTLRGMDLILFGLGAMIGTGIFTTSGIVASTMAGPALVISIVIGAVSVGISALIFAEFSSRMPSHGGVYGYIYAVFGELPAWIAGWLALMEFFLLVAVISSSWGAYLKGLFHFKLPAVIAGSIGTSHGFSVDLVAIFVVILIAMALMMNLRILVTINNILVVLKFSALIVFIVAGLFYINPSNWSNFAPFGFGHIFGGDDSGIMAGASFMFIAFLGFEAIPLTVDESREPRKSIPYGIFAALVTTVIFYAMVVLVLTGVVNYKNLNVPNGLAYALQSIGLNWASAYVSVVAVVTLITVGVAMAYALSRVIYGMSRDGLLPRSLSLLSHRRRVPYRINILIGLVAIVVAGFIPLRNLIQLLNLSTILYLIMLALAVIKLRRDFGEPGKNEIKTPLVPILPIFSVIFGIILISHYNLETYISLGISLAVALLVYLTYGYRHSKLNRKKSRD